MSDKLMNTEVGGEQTQYESIGTFVKPHDKKYGQLANASEGTSVDTKTCDPGAPNTLGITPADKVRYGQSIQEGGMGGKTTSWSGEAKVGTGLAKTEALGDDDKESAAKQRREQGYGGNKDMDRTIGA